MTHWGYKDSRTRSGIQALDDLKTRETTVQIDSISDVVLEASNISRSFDKGNFLAIEDISLAIRTGQIHALLGPNGAGKTTTVRICATLLTPSTGEVFVGGIDAVRYPERARRRMGLVLGGELGFYPRASARDNLLFFADLQGLPNNRRKQSVTDALERVGLIEASAQKTRTFSRGMLQRLHLARALLGSPQLLLLDEPTMGLDPDISLQVRDIIRELASQGVGILLTSHTMPEVEELADVISVIGAGKIAVQGDVRAVASYAAIQAVTTMTLPARFQDAAENLRVLLPAGSEVFQRPVGPRWSLAVYWPNIGDKNLVSSGEAQLDQFLASQGEERPVDFITRPASLEEAYLALAGRLTR